MEIIQKEYQMQLWVEMVIFILPELMSLLKNINHLNYLKASLKKKLKNPLFRDNFKKKALISFWDGKKDIFFFLKINLSIDRIKMRLILQLNSRLSTLIARFK